MIMLFIRMTTIIMGLMIFKKQGLRLEITNNGNPMSIEVCDGESATFFVDSQTDDAIFRWTVNGAPVFDGSKYTVALILIRLL